MSNDFRDGIESRFHDLEANIQSHDEDQDCYDTIGSKVMKWYMGECCGHDLHVTEFFCILTLAGCVATAYLVSRNFAISVTLLGALLGGISGASVAIIWGYAKIMALADSATKLEGIAGRGILEREQYRKLNDTLSEQTDIYSERLNAMGKEVGLISHDANKIDEMIAPLEAMQERLHSLNREQVRLGDGEDAFAEEQRLANSDRELELVKEEFKLAFKFIAASTNGVVGTRDQVSQLRDELVKIGVPWNQDCIAAVADGEVHKYEIVNIIDKALHTRIYRMRFAMQELADAQLALSEREAEHMELTARVNKMKGITEEKAAHMAEKKAWGRANSTKPGGAAATVSIEGVRGPALVAAQGKDQVKGGVQRGKDTVNTPLLTGETSYY